MIYFLYCSRFRTRTKVPSLGIAGNTFQKVSYQSLRQATGGFSEANLIGVGGFGLVYKGILDQGGQVVAVKVLNLEFRGASKSFLADCKALKSMKHRNLVKVLTACSSIDYHGNDFKALVYEFLVNGSLDKWLHLKENEDAANADSRHLSLRQRLDIAIDVASALDYIHNHCPEPIVHCDLKPSNILLDNEMTAHVGDFGLAKIFPKAIVNSSQFHDMSSSLGIRGSAGYAAPEYGMGNEVSTSGDVYSYGILLLELFTGKRPTDDLFSDQLSLHNFVKMALPEQIEGIADPALFKQRERAVASSSGPIILYHSSSSGQRTLECLISVLKVGIACSEELPRDRMAINDVVAQLHVIRNLHFGG
ncbi:probable LRR receptor-like serine/threonine-protein kinase At3g47570 isoform X5 [Rhododendron vialii]|nr:probable LRR receptor-like serine/threonine-protein kinase At3g47570 isoform X5 [Rhododendron vialii]